MYSRHASSRSTVLILCYCLFLCLSVTALSGQSARVKSTSASATEVVYLLTNSTLLTYDVDRSSGFPTEVGRGVTLESVTNTVLLPSANDHFVYVTGYDSTISEYLWVYATDSTGRPLLPAVQKLSLADGDFGTGNFVINPNGTLAYAVEETMGSGSQMLAKIIPFTIDPTTGIVTRMPKPAATYKPNGPCTPAAEANFSIYGFNPSGTDMYDYWDCNYPFANLSATYFSRPVNQTTGQLGPDRQVFDWADGNFGIDVVNFTPNSILYFSVPNNDSQGMNSVNVYSLQGASQFSCTAAMLEACGYWIWNSVDPTGTFDFIQISPDSTQIMKIEPGAKKIVDTGNFVQGTVQAFAPDDALVYTLNPDARHPWLYPIYVFDSTTGEVTYTGGEIFADGLYQYVIPALRQ
jgi:hypothetical protein